MLHEQRTFGWIQNPSSTNNLKNVVSLFVPESEFYQKMVKEHLPLLKEAKLFHADDLYDRFLNALRQTHIPYSLLKGKGAGKCGRKNAKCSGLAQAAITGQQKHKYSVNGNEIEIKKPYTDDWSADGFLRWAISLGFLDYNYEKDTCNITSLGKEFVLATDEEEKEILGTAYLSYPPACRVLGILSDGKHYTKFEIGKQLGFTDEAGFTSIPQNIFVQAIYEAATIKEKNDIRNDFEGSSDKYARMICAWLCNIGWIKRSPKKVTETIGGNTYTEIIGSAFTITAEGLKNYKRAIGKSKLSRVPKIVYREMLASKAPNAESLRTRRAYILKYISGATKRTLQQIIDHLQTKGFVVSVATIKDDIKGFINIGLNIKEQSDKIHLQDTILNLSIPVRTAPTDMHSEQAIIKERVRGKLNNIDHKYLTLIDYSFQGKDCAEFEIFTIDLFVNELQFFGKHMGGTRKPDGIIVHNQNGVIIDNKAYSKGFAISRHMQDEMIRYVQENTERSVARNNNKWWDVFPKGVTDFSFLFISSSFKGNVVNALNGIKQATKINGGAITTENLLYFADAIKGDAMTKDTFFGRIKINDEVKY